MMRTTIRTAFYGSVSAVVLLTSACTGRGNDAGMDTSSTYGNSSDTTAADGQRSKTASASGGAVSDGGREDTTVYGASQNSVSARR